MMDGITWEVVVLPIDCPARRRATTLLILPFTDPCRVLSEV
jgi:hypothetical protein